MLLTPDTTLATVALLSDAHAAVLDRHHLDFCCRGRRTLADACTASGLDVRQVIAELETEAEARGATRASPPDGWERIALGDIVDFIERTHHRFTKEAIARISPLLAKVANRHGDSHRELVTVGQTFDALAADLTPHMLREERVLFPYIRALADVALVGVEVIGTRPAAGGVLPPPPRFGTVTNPIRMMMREHDVAAELLTRLDAATNGFSPPADACTSYRALYAALAELRLDLLKHVSLENNVLFPRAAELEAQLRARPVAAPVTSAG